MLLEILLCAALAGIILGGLWLLLAKLLLPIRSRHTFLILVGRDDGAGLEQDCRAYLLLRNLGAIERPLVIVDGGLNAEGLRCAESLCGLDGGIVLCPKQALLPYLET